MVAAPRSCKWLRTTAPPAEFAELRPPIFPTRGKNRLRIPTARLADGPPPGQTAAGTVKPKNTGRNTRGGDHERRKAEALRLGREGEGMTEAEQAFVLGRYRAK